MEHFVVFHKDVGGRTHDTYFKNWQNARRYMLHDIADCKKHGWDDTPLHEGFNSGKGFAFCDCWGSTPEGEAVCWCLLDAYFDDHLLDFIKD